MQIEVSHTPVVEEKPQVKPSSSPWYVIGIPAEENTEEKRVSITPSNVRVLTEAGYTVLVESGAGEGAGFSDEEYIKAGAKVKYSKEEVYKAPIILKINLPEEHNIKYLREGQVIISAMQLGECRKSTIEKLIQKRVIGIAWEFIQDEDGTYPLVRSMSEIAGRVSILLASHLLFTGEHSRGELLGNIPGLTPSKVLIIGAGAVGEFALRTAAGLGASVKVYDYYIYRLRRLSSIIPFNFYSALIDESSLMEDVREADVVVASLRPRERLHPPKAITEEMVKKMKKGSVIIDVSVDVGGCVETSRKTTISNPYFVKYGVIHVCVPNLPSFTPGTASRVLGNFFTPLLLNIKRYNGLMNAVRAISGLRNGIYLFHTYITNKTIADMFSFTYHDPTFLFLAI